MFLQTNAQRFCRMEAAFQKSSKLEVKYTKSSFDLHSFYTELNNDVVMFQVIQMLDSIYIWIGYKNQPKLNDMSIAIKNKYENLPIASRLIGDSTEETSKNMAVKLCKKLNKVVYISLNVEESKFSIPVLEKRMHEEYVKYPDKF